MWKWVRIKAQVLPRKIPRQRTLEDKVEIKTV